LLAGLGIRTPRVHALDRSRAVYPSDFALVEDVTGDTLEARLDRGEPRAVQATARLGEALRVMHGWPAWTEAGPARGYPAGARSASEMAQAALTSPMWLNACGKLPSSSPVSASTSSASRPRSLR
jgi:aminoglycoside phosphotransferase (APT) family kinase protein